MKIAIIGDGALGCLFSAELSKTNEVILLTHTQEKTDIINQNGLSVTETDHHIDSFHHLRAYASGTYQQQVDLVVILVKATQTAGAVQQNLPVIGPHTLVLTLQNGMGNKDIITQYIPESQLLLGTINHNSVLLDTGKVFHSGIGITSIGSQFVPYSKLEEIRDVFLKSGLGCAIVDNIGFLLWKKLFVNIAINAFTYITQTPMGFITHNTEAGIITSAVLREAVQVAQAEGFSFNTDEIISFVREIADTHPMGYSSMSQDRKKGHLTEIDFINGAVVRLTQKHHLSVPYNELIVNLVHTLEQADRYNEVNSVQL